MALVAAEIGAVVGASLILTGMWFWNYQIALMSAGVLILWVSIHFGQLAMSQKDEK